MKPQRRKIQLMEKKKITNEQKTKEENTNTLK